MAHGKAASLTASRALRLPPEPTKQAHKTRNEGTGFSDAMSVEGIKCHARRRGGCILHTYKCYRIREWYRLKCLHDAKEGFVVIIVFLQTVICDNSCIIYD